MSETYEFEVWQDGEMVAGASSAVRSLALLEINRYAAVYAADAPVVVMEVTRREVDEAGHRKEGRALSPGVAE